MLALLERASVYIHLDPRHEGVRVPAWFKKQPQLVLQVGLNMAVPIRDLAVDDDAVSGTLSFSRSPFFCYIPWKTVFALVGEDSRGMVWPEDIPPEVVAQVADQKRAAQKPALRALDAAEDGAKIRPTVVRRERAKKKGRRPSVPTTSAPATSDGPAELPAIRVPPICVSSSNP